MRKPALCAAFLVYAAPASAAPETPITMDQAKAELAPHGDGKLHGNPADWPEAERGPMLAEQARGLLLARREGYRALAAGLFASNMTDALGAEVVELHGDEATVHAVRPAPGGFVSVARVEFDAGHPTGVLQPVSDQPLDTTGSTASQATQLAAADPRFVQKWPKYQADCVPWSDVAGDGWAVYLTPATTDPAHSPLGGGYRVHVSADGKTIVDYVPLSRAVIEVPLDKMEGGAGMFTATAFTPVPDATYIAYSKIHAVTLYVVTSDAAWGINGDALYRLDLPR